MAVPVYSDYEGLVYEVPSYTKPSGAMTPMGSKQKNNLQANPQLSFKEGQYVAMGESIFDIVNVKIVAVILQIDRLQHICLDRFCFCQLLFGKKV